MSFTPSNWEVPREHFTNKTINPNTHNQNPIFLKYFFHRHPWLPLTPKSLFLSLKTHKPISLPPKPSFPHLKSLQTHKYFTLFFLFLSPSPMAAPTPQISLPSLLLPSPTIYGQPNVIFDSVKGIKCQP